MIRTLLPVSALLLGSFCLFFAGGMHSLILPVRGAAEGFSAFSLGLLGTGWAIGYVTGCLVMARLVARVGHIRAFSIMASIAAMAILFQLLFLVPWFWIGVRAASGFCFAGAAMIVESWLGDRADASSRGRIFGVYTMVNLGATTGGQMAIAAAEVDGFEMFVTAAIFYALALIPTAISSSTTPRPIVSVRINPRLLWRNSPVSVFGVFMVGLSNATFGTLAAVYGSQIGLSITQIALFASVPILAGAAVQVPMGILSDRIDRRRVLIGLAVIALLADAAFIALMPGGMAANLVLAGVFGAMVYSMYPVLIAHANDNATDENPIEISGGLLMIFGLGSIVGPLFAGGLMTGIGPRGLFAVTAVAHIAIAVQATYRVMRRPPVATTDKVDFLVQPPGRTATPATYALAATDAELADIATAAPETPPLMGDPETPPAETAPPAAPETPPETPPR